jgi:aspartyl-tRNA(Asn)/glutamyl-tRNA(Gln) amidotransferase subunit C
MTEINEQQIKKIAQLSRISLSKEEEQDFAQQISKIISWVEKLEEVDTNQVEPMLAVEQDLPLREDEVKVNNNSEDILKNSPKSQYDFYAVPKFIN